MKKVYEKPTVEKIAFNYRDQVVATSGGATSNNQGFDCGRTVFSDGCDVQNLIVMGYNVCSRL